ncbi:acyltransferase family protein [Hyphomonas johnsonii]|uniref:Acyltransferase family protein n=1 Tax=Hyphomonas johnsonii MHS-2 TaxID=1280950 RepID=A0A059FJ88_9PROT|nr:acyltransferase [Hyphomonas johnsonii]KCZ90709.1 acyltransferase family protein [Hyphomonas johnsonii MHS-2]
MTRGFSLYLDALRFLAALVVFASHMGYARFTGGNMQWIRDLNLGSDAVVVFFVLSGFVIAYTTFARNRGPAAYAEARFARLYSVIIPALVLTFALDTLGTWIEPAAYAGWWYNGEDRAGQLAQAMTFTTQVWFDATRVGSNGPFWSVAYEAWYYAGFGVAVFCRGRVRVLLLLLMAAIVGPRVLLLAPCWLLGVLLQQAVHKGHAQALSRATGWLLAVVPWILYAGAQAIHLPTRLANLTYILLGKVAPPNSILGFSDEFIWNFLIAVLMALHFLGVYRLAREATWISARAETAIRWAAGATFSLYLFHYPILTFLHGLPGYDSASVLHPALMATAALIACFALAEISERRLGAWKRLVHAVFRHVSAWTAGPAVIAKRPS